MLGHVWTSRLGALRAGSLFGVSSFVRTMKVRFVPLLSLLFVLLLLLCLFVPAMAAEEALEQGSGGDTEITEDINTPSIEETTLSEAVQYLSSINTYLTYLFMFGVVWLLIAIGRLIYKLLRMFF